MEPIEHLRYVARSHGVDGCVLAEETAYALGSLHCDPSGLVVACRRIVERHPFTGLLWWLCANTLTSSDPFEAVWDLVDIMRSDATPAELAKALPELSIDSMINPDGHPPDGHPTTDVVTIGAPTIIVEGLARRGDVRVLTFDVAHSATSFVRRFERHGVDYEPVDGVMSGAVVQGAQVVLVEALALDRDRVVAPGGSSTIAGLGAALGTPVWLVAGVGRRLPSSYLDAMVKRRDELAIGVERWSIDVEVLPASLFAHVVGPRGTAPMGPPAVRSECPLAAELLNQSPM